MHPRAILAIARKDTLDILLNKSTLIILISPIVLAVLFTVLNGVLYSQKTNLLIYNPGNSAIEQVVSNAFTNVVITRASSPADVSAAFGVDGTHKGSIYTVGLVVPPNFDADLRAGSHPRLSIFMNGDDVSTQQSQLLQQALTDYARAVASPQAPVSIAAATINPPKPNAFVTSGKGFFVMFVLLSSLMVGTSVVPGLLTEEKERKTVRMLMVSPASFGDIVMGKLIVGLVYQLILLAVVLVVMQGFMGQISLLLAFMVLGAGFSIALGLLGGSIFNTTSGSGAFAGFGSFIYVLPALFVGPLGQALQGNVIVQIMKVMPTYYLAEGLYNALLGQSTLDTILLDGGIALGSIVVLFLASVWFLRRQATVMSTI
ncbi:MAG: ABC transporter permease [Ktedonobacteraceae bacterium]